MKKQGAEMLFWGSCWGLMEATLGYLLHALAISLPGLPGFILFPVAVWIMRQAIDSTGRKDIVLQMSAIAAGLKLMDFMVMGNDPIRIINPALSILMEGAAVSIVVSLSSKMSLDKTFLMGFLWRGVFLAYMVLISFFGRPAGLVTSGWDVAGRFWILESAVNALIISGLSRVTLNRLSLKPQWTLAISVSALAILAQWVV